MLPDRVSNPGPLTYESGVLPIALRGPAFYILKNVHCCTQKNRLDAATLMKTQITPSSKNNQKDISNMHPDLALHLIFNSSNYPCLEHTFIVQSGVEPSKFYCTKQIMTSSDRTFKQRMVLEITWHHKNVKALQ